MGVFYRRVTAKLHGGGIVLRDEVYGRELKTKEQQVVEAEQVLVAEIDAKMGGFGVVPTELAGAIVSSHYYLYDIDTTKVLPNFLDYCLRLGPYEEQIQYFVKGSTNYAAIRPYEFLELSLPLPPPEIQQQFVARLARQRAVVEQAEALLAALGEAGIDDAYFAGVEGEWVELGEVCDINKENIEPKVAIPERLFRYVDIGSVDSNGWITDFKEILGKDAPQRAKRVMHTNDVILSTVRPYLKAFALVPAELDGQICSTGFAVLTPKASLLPEYLLFVVRSNAVVEQLKQKMHGSNYPAVDQEDVSTTRIILPDLVVQAEVTRRLRQQRDTIAAVEKTEADAEQVMRDIVAEVLSG
jgi:type I restriction enzyme S subunit